MQVMLPKQIPSLQQDEKYLVTKEGKGACTTACR